MTIWMVFDDNGHGEDDFFLSAWSTEAAADAEAERLRGDHHDAYVREVTVDEPFRAAR